MSNEYTARILIQTIRSQHLTEGVYHQPKLLSLSEIALGLPFIHSSQKGNDSCLKLETNRPWNAELSTIKGQSFFFGIASQRKRSLESVLTEWHDITVRLTDYSGPLLCLGRAYLDLGGLANLSSSPPPNLITV